MASAGSVVLRKGHHHLGLCAAASIRLGLRVASSVGHALETRRSSHQQSSGDGEEGGGGCR